jgi:hypothetical protein
VKTLNLTACGWNPDKPDQKRLEVQETIAAFTIKDLGIKTFLIMPMVKLFFHQ